MTLILGYVYDQNLTFGAQHLIKGDRIKTVFQVSEEANIVKGLGARFYSNAAKTWIKISRLLVDKYGSDPRNITREPLEIAEVKKRLKEFPYLRGNKLSNFYIRAMGETGLFKVKNLNDLGSPFRRALSWQSFLQHPFGCRDRKLGAV